MLLFYNLTIRRAFCAPSHPAGHGAALQGIGYPVHPAAYLPAAGPIGVFLLIYKPNFTWPGLIMVLLGAQVYFIWGRRVST